LTVTGDTVQPTVGGAIATGTHDSGGTLGPMHAQVRGVELVDGTGAHRWVGPDQLPAARLAVGALGVVTRVRLAVVPAHRLVTTVAWVALDDVLTDIDHHVSDHRHAGFTWLPQTRWCRLTLADLTDQPPSTGRLRALRDTVIGPAARHVRSRVRFTGMEYAMPRAALPSVLSGLAAIVREGRVPVVLPIQVRMVAADRSAWLSPAWDRDSVCVAVRQLHGLPSREWFLRAEEVFRAHDGRPHWGQVHTLTAPALARLYPRWGDFAAVRQACDPTGVFCSPHMARLWGEGRG
jgi:L-gulonolactone oxidase